MQVFILNCYRARSMGFGDATILTVLTFLQFLSVIYYLKVLAGLLTFDGKECHHTIQSVNKTIPYPQKPDTARAAHQGEKLPKKAQFQSKQWGHLAQGSISHEVTLRPFLRDLKPGRVLWVAIMKVNILKQHENQVCVRTSKALPMHIRNVIFETCSLPWNTMLPSINVSSIYSFIVILLMTTVSACTSKQQRQHFKLIYLRIMLQNDYQLFLAVSCSSSGTPFLLLYHISFQFNSHHPPSKSSLAHRHQSLCFPSKRRALMNPSIHLFQVCQDFWDQLMDCAFVKAVIKANLWFSSLSWALGARPLLMLMGPQSQLPI